MEYAMNTPLKLIDKVRVDIRIGEKSTVGSCQVDNSAQFCDLAATWHASYPATKRSIAT